MTEEQIALAHRAVACKGWRWLPGMLALEWAAPGMTLTGGRPFRVDDGWHEVGVYAPDLTDPATLGCLLALVREAWGKPNGQMRFDGVSGSDPRGWYYYWTENDGSIGGGLHWYSPTDAEALVAALEAAP